MTEKDSQEALRLLKKRHSVRAYSEEPVDEALIRKFEADITMINTHEAGFHFALVTNDPGPFEAFDKSYGSFRNVRNYLACIVDKTFPDVYERAGYYAEEFAIYATENGLGTCFVAGTYSPGKIALQLRADWELLFVVAFGYPVDKERFLARMTRNFFHRKEIDSRDFFVGNDSEYTEACKKFRWFPDALEALAAAPSSLNKRPVRLRMENGEIRAYLKKDSDKSRIDLGIAKYNMGFISPGTWEWGNDAQFYED